MRKSISILLIFLLFFIFVGCGKQSADNGSVSNEIDETVGSAIVDTTSDNENNENDEVVNELLPGTIKVPLYELYCDTPDMHYIEKGCCNVYLDDWLKVATFIAYPGENATMPKESFDVLFPYFKAAVKDYSFLTELKDIEEKTLVVNGREVYAFEGKASMGLSPEYDGYIKGYSLVVDGIPCAVIGFVIDREQPEAEIEYISDVVDAMVESIRTEA